MDKKNGETALRRDRTNGFRVFVNNLLIIN